jgi:hypothetical protein
VAGTSFEFGGSGTAGGLIGSPPPQTTKEIRNVDLQVDSDNNDGFLLPDPRRTEAEDRDEDDPGKPGKTIVVNDDDGDSDGIPDFADGFNWDGLMSYDDVPAKAPDGEWFVPVVIRLPSTIDPTKAWLKIEYEASDPMNGPNGLTRSGSGTEGNPYAYTPEPGDLRLWTKDGFNATTPGDFVDATNDFDRYHAPADLAKLDWHLTPDGGRRLTLHAEAVTPSTAAGDNRIVIRVDPDGAGGAGFVHTDEVRLTATQVAVVRDARNDHAAGADPVAAYTRIGHWGEDAGG